MLAALQCKNVNFKCHPTAFYNMYYDTFLKYSTTIFYLVQKITFLRKSIRSEICIIKNVVMTINFINVKIKILIPFVHKLSSHVYVVQVRELW